MNRKGKRMNVVKAFCLFTLLGCFIGCKDDEKKKIYEENGIGITLYAVCKCRCGKKTFK